jgi:hypothetical protein
MNKDIVKRNVKAWQNEVKIHAENGITGKDKVTVKGKVVPVL